MKEVLRQDGIRGLYRGLTPGVTLSMTEASIRYMTYGVCQVFLFPLIFFQELYRYTSDPWMSLVDYMYSNDVPYIQFQDLVRKVLTQGSSEKMSISHNALAGGLTGFFSTFASCPIEVIKCRMQGSLEMTGGSGMKSK